MIVSPNSASPSHGVHERYAGLVGQCYGNVGAPLLAHMRMVEGATARERSYALSVDRAPGSSESGSEGLSRPQERALRYLQHVQDMGVMQDAEEGTEQIIELERRGLVASTADTLGRLARAEPNMDTGRNAASRLLRFAATADALTLGDWLLRKATAFEHAQTAPMFTSAVSQVKDAYAGFVTRAVSSGWFPNQAQDQVAKVHDTHIRLADAAVLPDVAVAATHRFGDGHVLVYSEGTPTDAAVATLRVGPHELHHATIQNRPEISTAQYRLPEWLIEAMAEHARATLAHGSFDILNPTARQKDTGGYPYNRQLASKVLNGLPVELMTRADSGGDEEGAQLRAALQESWQVHDPLVAIDRALEADVRQGQARYPYKSPHVIAHEVLKGYCKSVPRVIQRGAALQGALRQMPEY